MLFLPKYVAESDSLSKRFLMKVGCLFETNSTFARNVLVRVYDG